MLFVIVPHVVTQNEIKIRYVTAPADFMKGEKTRHKGLKIFLKKVSFSYESMFAHLYYLFILL